MLAQVRSPRRINARRITLDAIRHTLEGAAHEVVTLKSPFSMVASIREERPDLILIDVAMPALSGDQAVKILKKSRFGRHIPILFLSSKDPSELSLLVAGTQAQGYVSKSAGPEVLVRRVARALRTRGRREAR